MNIEEILKAATPRPWIGTKASPNNATRDGVEGGDDALAQLAVNAYESDRAKIKALVRRLRKSNRALTTWRNSNTVNLALAATIDKYIELNDAALKLAGGE